MKPSTGYTVTCLLQASMCRFLHFLPRPPLFTSILPISPNLPFLLRLNMSAGHQVRNKSENYRIFSDLATVNNFAHKTQGQVVRWWNSESLWWQRLNWQANASDANPIELQLQKVSKALQVSSMLQILPMCTVWCVQSCQTRRSYKNSCRS